MTRRLRGITLKKNFLTFTRIDWLNCRNAMSTCWSLILSNRLIWTSVELNFSNFKTLNIQITTLNFFTSNGRYQENNFNVWRTKPKTCSEIISFFEWNFKRPKIVLLNTEKWLFSTSLNMIHCLNLEEILIFYL